ncbi:MAG: hypothetical protein AAB215_04730 [Planctomycetota bacterium]
MTQETKPTPSSPGFGMAGSLALAALLVAVLAWYRAAAKPAADPAADLRERVAQLEKRIEDVSAASTAADVKAAAPIAPKWDQDEGLRKAVEAIVRESQPAAEEKAKTAPVALPEAAKKALEGAVPGIEIVRVRSQEQDGTNLLEVEGRANGDSITARLTPGGQFDSLSGPASIAPKAVRDSAAAAVPGVEFRRVRRRMGDGETIYVLKGQAGKDSYEVEVRATGEVRQIDMPLSKAPKAVQDAAAKAAPGVNLRKDVEWEVNTEGEAYYDVRGKAGEKDVRIRIAEDGKILRREGLEAPPPPADTPVEPPPGAPPGPPPGPPPGDI